MFVHNIYSADIVGAIEIEFKIDFKKSFIGVINHVSFPFFKSEFPTLT